MSLPTKPKELIAQKLIGLKTQASYTTLTQNNAILYALGIGFSQDPFKSEDYKFTNQFHKNFTSFPTIAVVLSTTRVVKFLMDSPFMPTFNIHHVLHAEQKLTLFKDHLPINSTFVHERQIVDIIEKGKNAFVLYKGSSYFINDKGQKQLAFQLDTLLFIKGVAGLGFQGKGIIASPIKLPSRSPDFHFIAQTYTNQAFVYRLSNDRNPFHIDPEVAKAAKFEKPILHGLASYGSIAKFFVQNVLSNQEKRLRSMRGRFIGHVFPGEAMQVFVWKNGLNYLYEASIQARKSKVLVGEFETWPASTL